MDDRIIRPNYEVISAAQKRQLLELFHTVLFDMFSEQDFQDVVAVFARIIERLEVQSNA